jgi:pyrroloquinoline-quinone synthase
MTACGFEYDVDVPVTAQAIGSVLAPPRRPVVPSLTEPLGPTELAAAVETLGASYYANHPFHTLMHEGRLTERQLQGWVANRLVYQRALPRKNAAIISNCFDSAIRREWLPRVVYQDGTSPDTGGIELWIRLGEAVGVPRHEMEDERHVLPGVRFAAEAYVTFCKTHSWVDGVAASLIEVSAADVMRQRILAFPRHYPWVDAQGLEYFRSRVSQAPRDGGQGMRLVIAHCTTADAQQRALAALGFHLELLSMMIDTIHQAYSE